MKKAVDGLIRNAMNVLCGFVSQTYVDDNKEEASEHAYIARAVILICFFVIFP